MGKQSYQGHEVWHEEDDEEEALCGHADGEVHGVEGSTHQQEGDEHLHQHQATHGERAEHRQETVHRGRVKTGRERIKFAVLRRAHS